MDRRSAIPLLLQPLLPSIPSPLRHSLGSWGRTICSCWWIPPDAGRRATPEGGGSGPLSRDNRLTAVADRRWVPPRNMPAPPQVTTYRCRPQDASIPWTSTRYTPCLPGGGRAIETPPGARPEVPTVPKHILHGELAATSTLTGPIATPPQSEERGPPAKPCKLRAPSKGDRRGWSWARGGAKCRPASNRGKGNR